MVGVQEGALSDEQKNIAVITIDGNVIGGYKSYSFVRVKEYVKEPQRSQNGQIANLDSYTTFITPKVRIKFNALSIDGYRMLMNLILSKNEFYVGCYDFTATDENHPNGRWVHQNMYFYPNDYPEIFQYDLDVLAVLNYEIELIGTNTNNENIVIRLNSNYPSGTTKTDKNGNTISSDVIYIIPNAYQNEFVVISYPSTFAADGIINVDNVRFEFDHWNTEPDGSGVSYYDNNEISFATETDLYAIWSSNKVNVVFITHIMVNNEWVTTSTSKLVIDEGATLSTDNTPQYLNDTHISFSGWFKDYNANTDTYSNTIYGLRPYDLNTDQITGFKVAYGKWGGYDQ